MKRKFTLIIDLAVGSLVFATAIAGSGLAFAISGISYLSYQKKYNAEVAELKKQLPVAPKEVFIDNEFVTYDSNKEFIESTKSTHENIRTIKASETNVITYKDKPKLEIFDYTSHYNKSIGGFDNTDGGQINFTIYLEDYCDGDIDIVLASANYDINIMGNTPTRRLAEHIDIKFDNLPVDVSLIDLPCSDKNEWFEFQHVILHDLHFKKGKNTLTISSNDISEKIVVPNISLIHVFADKPFEKELGVRGDTMMLVNENNKTYLEFSGIAIGYEASRLGMDLCFNQSTQNQIPYDAYQIKMKDGMFLMKVDCDALVFPTRTILSNNEDFYMYSHFYLDGELYDSGRVEGDIMSVIYDDPNWNNPQILQTVGDYQLIVRSIVMGIYKK